MSNFLRAFVRHVHARKLLTLITVASLTIGLTVLAMAWLYVKQELSYDRGWPNAERILRLTLEQRGLPGSADGTFNSVNPRAWPSLLDYFDGQLDRVTRVAATSVRIGNSDAGPLINISFVDPAFADIFQLEVLSGSMEQVLQNPGFLAVSESRAEVFGPDLQLGERVMLRSFNGNEQEFVVGAIFRNPSPTSVTFDLLSPITDTPRSLFGEQRPPWESGIRVWLTLEDGISTEAFNAQMPAFITERVTAFNEALPPGTSISDHLFYRFQPITAMHFNPVGFEVMSATGNKARVITFTAIGLLVLLVGCSNAISLSLATVLDRRKEIGIRKACGAGRTDILIQHLGEAVLLALVAFALAVGLQALLMPGVLALLTLRGEFPMAAADVAMLGALAVMVGLLNAVYPAFVLSGVRPERVLKAHGEADSRGSLRTRTLLVGAQFSFALMFMSGAVALYAQLALTSQQPLGFNTSNLLVSSSGMSANQELLTALLNSLRSLSGVDAVVESSMAPNQNLPLSINGSVLVSKGEVVTQRQVTNVSVAPGFLELLEIPLLAGRYLDSERDGMLAIMRARQAASDQEGEEEAPIVPILLNAAAVHALDFVTPDRAVGKLVYEQRADQTGAVRERPMRVVGVVANHMFSSVHRLPLPERYTMLLPGFPAPNFLIKYDPAAAGDIQRRVDAVYQEITGNTPFLSFVEQRIESAFIRERSEGRLLLYAAAIALFLSCVGLYGLAASTMVRSVKEVGVRKVLGAGTGGVVALFMWRFTRPVLLANLVAWPVAGYFVIRWIQRFPYQLDVAWLPPLFLGASVAVLLVAWVTVGGVTARAALRPPVQSLRYE